jgi:hypothetical protein
MKSKGMRRIFKYPIPIQDYIELDLPVGAQILTVQVQHNVPCLWALVTLTLDETTEPHRFYLFGTGHPMPDNKPKLELQYVGTFQLHGGELVFHLFEYK